MTALLPLLAAGWAFIKAHWRPFALAGLATALFFAGRYSAPKPTVTVRTEVQWKDRVVTQVVEKQTSVTDQAKTVIVYRDRVVHRDGTVEDKTETRETTGTETRLTDDKTGTETATSEGTQHQTVTIKQDAPRVSLNALVGSPLSLTSPALEFGASGSYRFLGPFTVGGWFLVDPQGGHAQVGVSLGVTF